MQTPVTRFDGGDFLRGLEAGGVDFCSGVPCSILSSLLESSTSSTKVEYIPATVEGEALAMCAGAWLSGGLGVALLQNSGLGNVINPLTSLFVPYKIPVLMVVSWRGSPTSSDAAHHLPMGSITPKLLELLSVRTWEMEIGRAFSKTLKEALSYIAKTNQPAAFLIPPGYFSASKGPDARANNKRSMIDYAKIGASTKIFRSPGQSSRIALTQAIKRAFPTDFIVSTTGFASRLLHQVRPSDRNFYMQGSMGYAAAIGIGTQRRKNKEIRTVIIDGDGALLMRLGTLATAGGLANCQLIHIVTDNQAYASTGGQPCSSRHTDFAKVAAGCNYKNVAHCAGPAGFERALNWATNQVGATLVHAEVEVDAKAEIRGRPDIEPYEIANRFREEFRSAQTTPGAN